MELAQLLHPFYARLEMLLQLRSKHLRRSREVIPARGHDHLIDQCVRQPR
jgi:hypothetical protein